MNRKEHLEIIREILTIAALFMGGVWAVYQSAMLYKNDIAKLNLQKLQKETNYQPVMDVKVTANSWQARSGERFIEATATVKNVGLLKDTLDLTNKPFRIYPVVFKEGSLPVPTKAWIKADISFPEKTLQSTLLPQAAQSYRLLYKAPKAGLYYVQFKVPLSQKGREQWLLDKTQLKKLNLEWSDGIYVDVKLKE